VFSDCEDVVPGADCEDAGDDHDYLGEALERNMMSKPQPTSSLSRLDGRFNKGLLPIIILFFSRHGATETALLNNFTETFNCMIIYLGFQMLERQGWARWTGLGASAQGVIDPIREKVAWGREGLGYSWSGHNDGVAKKTWDTMTWNKASS